MRLIHSDSILTDSDVIKINEILEETKDDIRVLLPNTVNQNPEVIKKLNEKIVINVNSGYEPSKKKYDNEYYQRRVCYSPSTLVQIINIFQKIESKINPNWTELQKCMFVYKIICENLSYEYDEERREINGREICRNLEGLIYHKSVCAGIANIFKEAMDRLGIECHYQNKESHHCWNVVKLEGKYYGLDLTWDIEQKEDNKCGFRFFGRNKNFYDNKHHDISEETNETKFDLSVFDDQLLLDNYKVISENKAKNNRVTMNKLTNIKGETVYYFKKATTKEKDYYFVTFNNIPYFIGVPLNSDLKEEFTGEKIMYSVHRETKTYVRNDQSGFCITPSNEEKLGVKQYYYYEIRDTKDDKKLIKYALLSENDLTNPNEEIEDAIANSLLSQKRVERQINTMYGYVGFIGKNNSKYRDIVYEQRLDEENQKKHLN